MGTYGNVILMMRMTNNFDLIKNYMINEGIPMKEKDMGDLFFCVMLVRRGKDHRRQSLGQLMWDFQNHFDS